MIRHVWSVLCKEAVIAQDSNLISIRDALERFEIQVGVSRDEAGEKPKIAIPTSFEIVSFFVRDLAKKPEKFSIQLRLIDPLGEELGSLAQELEFKASTSRLRNRIKVEGFPLTVSGIYNYEIYTDIDGEKPVARLPLEVDLKVTD